MNADNLVILHGNMVETPELRSFGDNNEKHSVLFTVAVNRTFKNKSTDKFETSTEFVPCEAWDTGAERIAKVLQKGDPVRLEGSLKQNSWTDKDSGQKKSVLRVRVEHFKKLARFTKPTDEVASDESEPEVEAASVQGGDDIPF